MFTAKRLVSATFLLFVIGGSILVAANQRSILDWWALRDFNPSESVAALADDTAMTAYARRIFYVNQPQLLEETTEFREVCPINEQSIVLGCYHSNQSGIYIFDVSSSELEGVEEVTAAHEMLHAAYDRLSADNKSKLNAQLNSFYENGLKNKRVINTVEQYRDAGTEHLEDEMHSIFATELSKLPTELEEHYRQYFSDRSKVVALSIGYEEVFTKRISQIEKLDERLNNLKNDIKNQEISLTQQATDLENDRNQLDSLRNDNPVAYNAAIPAYNAKVNEYNNGVRRLQESIAVHNNLVESRNELAAELRGLNEAIDTRLQPKNTQ